MSLGTAKVGETHVDASPSPAVSEIWAGVDRLIDRAATLDDLRVHRLHLLAARRWTRLGRPLGRELMFDEVGAVARARSARRVLELVRDSVDAELLVMKGPVIAERYPEPALRPYGDLDVLVADAPRAQRRLLEAGFETVGPYDAGDFDGFHHLQPLMLRGQSVYVEVHSRCNWLTDRAGPGFAELAVVAHEGPIRGVRHPEPAAHAVLAAVHSWRSAPLRRLSDLLDVALLGAGLDPEAPREYARRWEVLGVWDATQAAIGAIFGDGREPWTMRVWARDLPAVRERTIFAHHLGRWLSPFASLPLHAAVPSALDAIRDDVSLVSGETRADKLRRVTTALLDPRRPVSSHNAALGPLAARRRPLRGLFPDPPSDGDAGADPPERPRP